ncbi:adenine glycosylase, partial [Sphaerisporangium cinnabarinum]
MTGPAPRPARTGGPARPLPRTAPGDPHAGLRDAVGRWFGATACDRPWRAADRAAWGVLVSEVMLQ